MHKKIFFDYASCTPVKDEIFTAYSKLVKECFINSQAVYQGGVEVHKLVETSRKQIAKLLNVTSEEIIFTSGASESNSFAIKGYALKNKHKGTHIITSTIEHSSVTHSMQQLEEEFGFRVSWLPVDKEGRISLQDLKEVMCDETILVSIMSVNNEIGTLQDIDEIARIVHTSSKAKLHVDAVQSIGKYSLDFNVIDMATFTSHKLYGVKGCGILYRKKNVALLPLVHGGVQEFSLRGGTLNAPACIVFAKTLRLALEEQTAHFSYVKQLNDYTRKNLTAIDDIVINSPKDASPYILNFSCCSIESEIMMNALNAKNIFVATQSTCSTRTKQPSHTLSAIGFEKNIIYGAIRVSFSHLSTMDEIDYLIKSVKEIINEYKTT